MKDDTLERRKNIVNIMSQNEEFIIIGLTGRVGAGCSEAAEIFASTYQQLELPWIQPGIQGLRNNEERDLRILQRYAGAHWLKFDIIRTRTIISSFLLEEFEEFIQTVAQLETNTDDKKTLRGKNEAIKKDLYEQMCRSIQERCHAQGLAGEGVPDEITLTVQIQEILKKLPQYSTDGNGKIEEDIPQYDKEESKKHDDPEPGKKEPEDTPPPAEKETDPLIHGVKAFQKIGEYYNEVDAGECMEERSRYLNQVETALSSVSVELARYILQTHQNNEHEDNIWHFMKVMEENLERGPLESSVKENISQSVERLKRFVFAHDLMPALGDAIHDYLRDKHLPFTELFQKYGNSIRCYGKVCYESTEGEQKASDIFAIPRRIVRFVKAMRHPFSKEYSRPVRIVIDSIKNVFEASYLRQRYSSFYLFAISADESIRRKRLMNSEKKSLTMEQIRFIDWNEYSSEGAEIYNQIKDEVEEIREKNSAKAEYKFYEKIASDHCGAILTDYVRREAYDKKLQRFYLQDVAASIENADVFISNNYDNEIEKNMHLLWAIVRNVCLIMFPGLLLPTPIEKCMQIAFAAKCNSGCLSRQVGAVVTDKEYNVLSIGCNDVPCGDISCARKNLIDLCKSEDSPAYTKYELTDPEFRKQIMKFQYRSERLSKVLRGLPMRYCFKDIHLKDKIQNKNPMRSRAMHAEEKALSASGEKCAGGYLFTTSSPCEMCSKNAKNHRIKKIYYIEVYPGISEAQYSASGEPENIAEHILFTGAIGRAYVQMYTPIMPQKDILELLGIYDEYWKT